MKSTAKNNYHIVNYGYAANKEDNLAQTVLGFRIISVYGHMKGIVSLIPVNNITGEQLNM